MLYTAVICSLLLCSAGTQTQQSIGEPPHENGQPSQAASPPENAETAPAPAPGESQPSNPPAEAEANDNKPEQQHHGIATVTDAAAVSSVVGANQPMTDEVPADEAADVAPADQAMTTKAEPGDPVTAPGTVDVASAAPAAEAAVVDVPTHLTDEERRLLDWHWANLEYGCSARLRQVRTTACVRLMILVITTMTVGLTIVIAVFECHLCCFIVCASVLHMLSAHQLCSIPILRWTELGRDRFDVGIISPLESG